MAKFESIDGRQNPERISYGTKAETFLRSFYTIQGDLELDHNDKLKLAKLAGGLSTGELDTEADQAQRLQVARDIKAATEAACDTGDIETLVDTLEALEALDKAEKEAKYQSLFRDNLSAEGLAVVEAYMDSDIARSITSTKTNLRAVFLEDVGKTRAHVAQLCANMPSDAELVENSKAPHVVHQRLKPPSDR